MPDARIDIILIIAGLIAWAGIFIASANGMLHVSWIVSDGLLALVAAGIGYCVWRIWRRQSQKRA